MELYQYQLYNLVFQSEQPLPNLDICRLPKRSLADVHIFFQGDIPEVQNVSYRQSFEGLEFYVGSYNNELATWMDFEGVGTYFILGGGMLYGRYQKQVHISLPFFPI